MKIVRLEVRQHGPDWMFPIGGLMQGPAKGLLRDTTYELFRRKHRGGEKQTWWVKQRG